MSTTGTSHAREIADNGGHFYRVDFQVHTPRDAEWDGDRQKDEAERKRRAALAWCEQLNMMPEHQRADLRCQRPGPGGLAVRTLKGAVVG